MNDEMRMLLKSLVKTAQAQIRQLNLQIEDYETQLRGDDTSCVYHKHD